MIIRSLKQTKSQAFGLLLASALLLVAAAPTALAHGDDDAAAWAEVPTVTVSGQGEVRVQPDEATVQLGVTAQAENAGAAQQQANEVANRILAAMGELGIEEKAVQTSRLNLYPVYADMEPRRTPSGAPQEPRIVAYRASNVVSVRLSDLTKIGPVVDAAVGAGANEVQGVSFQLRDDAEARREALKRAVAAARGKAEAIAAALGQPLGAVLQVREGGVSMEMPRYRATAVRFQMESMDAAGAPVQAGEVGVSASVEIAYRLATP